MEARPPWPWILLALAAGIAGWALGRATAPEGGVEADRAARTDEVEGTAPMLQGVPARRPPGRSPRPGGTARAPKAVARAPGDGSAGADAPAASAPTPPGAGPEVTLPLGFERRGPSALPGVPLLSGPDEPGPEESPRIAAARQAMAADPEGALARLEDLLASADAEERAAAYRLLGSARHPSHRALVTRALEEAKPGDDVRALLNALAAYKGPAWATVQMTGPPDTPLDGDLPTAWASKSPDMGEVWIELDYAAAVVVDAVRVHETLGPGCVARVLLAQGVGSDGTPRDWVEVWSGSAEPGTSPCWFEPRLAGSIHTRHVRLIVDTGRAPGWNEIDAVELVGSGLRQWAVAARAGSSYAD